MALSNFLPPFLLFLLFLLYHVYYPHTSYRCNTVTKKNPFQWNKDFFFRLFVFYKKKIGFLPFWDCGSVFRATPKGGLTKKLFSFSACVFANQTKGRCVCFSMSLFLDVQTQSEALFFNMLFGD